MRLAHAFLAKAAEVSSDGCFSALSADFDVLTAYESEKFLGPFVLLAKFWFTPNELGNHQFAVELERPGGVNRMLVVRTSLVVEPNSHDPKRESGAAIMLPMGIPEPTPGEYRLHLLMDGRDCADLAVRVISGPAM
jgi:hypothetical protein